MKEINLNGIKVKSFSLGPFVVGIGCEIGPRILWLSHICKPDFNLFAVLPQTGVQTPEGFWHIYGGHRLWSSPEAMPRSYSLDNVPVNISFQGKTITVSGQPEVANSIQKTIRITLHEKQMLKVSHVITNTGRWPITLAAWALSVMRPQGMAIIPHKPSRVDATGLLPDRHLSLWPYTDLDDFRFLFTKNFLFLRQEAKASSPVKIGVAARPNWAAYWVEDIAFVKTFTQENLCYPDYGCTVEVYTNNQFLELETVGPLKQVDPGQSITHVETWQVFFLKGKKNQPQKLAEELEKKICL